jgi:transposase
MFQVETNSKVWLILGKTDMRKSIDGLAGIVSNHLGLDASNGQYFVFCGRKKNTVKILYWDRNGYCLWYKRLEEDRFRWPKTKEDIRAVTGEQLSWLLSGLDWEKAYRERKYSA